MAKQQVTVPDIGGAEGAEVIELLVAVGDEISVEQSLIVLESDKASMEIPSTHAGTVVEVLVKEGQELAEGAPILVIETAAAAEQEAAPASSSDNASAQPEQVPREDTSPANSDSKPVPSDSAAATSASSLERITVPDIGSEEPVDLIEMCVKVGDSVAEGDSLVVLESDKASMEVPSPVAGRVVEILVSEGDSVAEGAELVVMEVVAGAEPGQPESAEQSSSSPVAAPQSPSIVEPKVATPAASAPSAKTGEGVYAGPAVRKLSREFGIALDDVSGTGPRGRVLKEDLHQFVTNRLQGAAPVAAGSAIPLIPDMDYSVFGTVEVTKRSKLDKLTAKNMQRSWLNVPHVTQFDDADISELEAFRGGLKGEAEKRGTKITPMPFILKACAVALRDNPKFATSLTDGGESLVYKKYINIGMAVDTPAGLVVPVIRDVDKKTIWELAEEVIEIAGKARDRKLKPAEMQGGCFTISSLGNIGGRGFTPIVNAPEVAILGVSRAEMKPVWDGQAFAPRKLLPLSLSYDHRVINGGDGGRFLDQLVRVLGDIRQMVM